MDVIEVADDGAAGVVERFDFDDQPKTTGCRRAAKPSKGIAYGVQDEPPMILALLLAVQVSARFANTVRRRSTALRKPKHDYGIVENKTTKYIRAEALRTVARGGGRKGLAS